MTSPNALPSRRIAPLFSSCSPSSDAMRRRAHCAAASGVSVRSPAIGTWSVVRGAPSRPSVRRRAPDGSVSTPATRTRPCSGCGDAATSSVTPSPVSSPSRDVSVRRAAAAARGASGGEIDELPAVCVRDVPQPRRIRLCCGGDRVDRDAQLRERHVAEVGEAVAEEQVLPHFGLGKERAEVGRAVVRSRLEHLAQRAPVAACNAEDLRCSGALPQEHQAHFGVAQSSKVGVEQREFARAVARRAGSRRVPDDPDDAGRHARRTARRDRNLGVEVAPALELLRDDLRAGNCGQGELEQPAPDEVAALGAGLPELAVAGEREPVRDPAYHRRPRGRPCTAMRSEKDGTRSA